MLPISFAETILVISRGSNACDWLNKVALVTGAGTGIGRATVMLFAQEGARVVAQDVNADTAQETAGLINKRG